MITEDQKTKLMELVEVYADAKAYHYYIEDQGTRECTKIAQNNLDKAEKELDDFVGGLE